MSVVVFAWAALRAEAQSTRRPDLNVFARAMRDPGQSLSVRASMGANVYDRITPPPVLPGSPLSPDHGWGTIASASLSYNVNLGAFTFDGSTGAFVTYYPDRADEFRTVVVPGGGVGVGWTWPVRRRTTLTFSSSLRHRPLSVESTVPLSGQIPRSLDVYDDPTLLFIPRDLEFVQGGYLTARSNVSVTHELTRRWVLLGDYGAQRDFSFNALSAQYGVWSQYARANVGYNILRTLRVRGGYRYEESHFKNALKPYRYNTLEVAVDFGDSATLRLTKRTTLTLDGGVGSFADAAGGTRLHLTGRALLQHQMGRTWSADLGFNRGLDSGFLLFQAPTLTDTASAIVSGLLTRELGFHALATAQRGAVGVIGAGTGIVRITGNAGLQMSLGSRLALGVDYIYYKFKFEQGVARPIGVPPLSSSQGLSVHLSTWAPLYQRRRSNVTR